MMIKESDGNESSDVSSSQKKMNGRRKASGTDIVFSIRDSLKHFLIDSFLDFNCVVRISV